MEEPSAGFEHMGLGDLDPGGGSMGSRTRAAGAALVLVGILATVILWAPAAGAAGGEGPVTVKVGELPVEFQFGVSPKLLPVGHGSVTRLDLADEVAPPSDGGSPPGIAATTIGLDRSIAIETRGLPRCYRPGLEGGPQIEPTGPDECDRAVVGRVEATVLVAYPDSKAAYVSGKGKAYSTGVRGRGTNLLLEIPLEHILEEPLWLVARVRPAPDGRIGSKVTIRVPELLGGYGFLTDLHLELGRTFARDGERVGYVQATCDGGKLTASDSTRLTDGTESHSESIRACTKRSG